jgi:solute carrier family 10 (sodium/bile acid cotransporter), member 7
MLKRLTSIPADGFLLALAATVGLAALLPAHGAAAEAVSAAAKAAIALLFFLYGTRLSPQQAWHGVRQWRLHLLVLTTTFVIFPVLGLAARVLVPSVLTTDLYNGLLFLCLVPSTVQSSIAFTSIARGNVSAAIVSASLSNMLGVVLTPLLVVLLMNTSGAPRVDGSAVRDIVLQLLLPFGVGQLTRPWLAAVVARYAAVLKVVDRGSILLVVYTAFSMGVVQGIWVSVDPWRLVLVTVVATVLLAVVLACTKLVGRLARLNRGDAIVLLFCGSKKSLASGLPMALVFFPAATVGLTMLPLMIFHQIQLVVCALIASRLARDPVPDQAETTEATGSATTATTVGEEP